MLTRLLSVGALAVMMTGAVLAEEKVDNPQYANWSKFKTGASVTVRSTTDGGNGITTVVTIRTTLLELATDKVVVEVEAIQEVTGSPKVKIRPKRQEILKSVPLPPGIKKAEFEKKLPGTVEEGTETVKIAGTEFKTTWYKTKVKSNENEIEAKTWVSDEVPGRIVKSESTSKGVSPYSGKSELVDIKKP
jgi:hypothetical protein